MGKNYGHAIAFQHDLTPISELLPSRLVGNRLQQARAQQTHAELLAGTLTTGGE